MLGRHIRLIFRFKKENLIIVRRIRETKNIAAKVRKKQ